MNPSVLVGLQVRVTRFQLELNPWALQHLSRCGRVRSQSHGCCSCLPCHCSQLATFVTCCRCLQASIYTVRADHTDVHRHLAPASPNDEACSHHGKRAKYRRYLRRIYASTLFSSTVPQLAAPAACVQHAVRSASAAGAGPFVVCAHHTSQTTEARNPRFLTELGTGRESSGPGSLTCRTNREIAWSRVVLTWVSASRPAQSSQITRRRQSLLVQARVAPYGT